MLRVALDSTILISAFLGQGGVSDAVLEQADEELRLVMGFV